MSEKMKVRETPVEGHDKSLISENQGLREVCKELIEALGVMVSSFPAPEKIKDLYRRLKPTIFPRAASY